ncbi:MAG: response regulator [Actinomycetota bacterium]
MKIDTRFRVAGPTETRGDDRDDGTSGDPAHDRPRILLADDNYFFRVGLRSLLADYEVEIVGEAGNGWEAVEQADALHPDIVLMDLRMPQLGGLEAARLIREHHPDTQAIILSAYDDPELRHGNDGATVADYLVKGSRPESIREALVAAYGAPVPDAPAPNGAEPDEEDVLQRLTAAQMQLATLRRATRDPDRRAALDELEHAVEIGIEGLRDMVFEIRPPALQTQGLGTTIEGLLARHAGACGYRWSVQDRLVSQPPAGLYGVALGIAREAIDNIRLHSEAQVVCVSLEERGGAIYIEIVDDGRGLSPADLSDNAVGLAAMRSRAEDVGGWCRIWSLPGAGTTVKIWLPR